MDLESRLAERLAGEEEVIETVAMWRAETHGLEGEGYVGGR